MYVLLKYPVYCAIYTNHTLWKFSIQKYTRPYTGRVSQDKYNLNLSILNLKGRLGTEKKKDLIIYLKKILQDDLTSEKLEKYFEYPYWFTRFRHYLLLFGTIQLWVTTTIQIIEQNAAMGHTNFTWCHYDEVHSLVVEQGRQKQRIYTMLFTNVSGCVASMHKT